MDNHHMLSAKNLLAIIRQDTDAIGVAVSFGKDSLVTLDLCCQTFRRVEAYYLFRVRGLELVEAWARQVFDRTGVKVRNYPHFDLSRCYRHAVLRPHTKQKVPAVKMIDLEARFRTDAKIDWIAYGWRRNDSLSRALIMKKCGGIDFSARRVFPLRSWRREQVYDYLRQAGIAEPERLGRKEQGGLDFNPAALRYLKENAPSDYERWLADFPFSGAQLIS